LSKSSKTFVNEKLKSFDLYTICIEKKLDCKELNKKKLSQYIDSLEIIRLDIGKRKTLTDDLSKTET
jgi:hypothetical protein